MRPTALRAEFPVLERASYLNAGTAGPVPARSAAAAAERMRAELEQGRSGARHFEERRSLWESVRGRLAGLLGCDPDEVALTHSTTDGVNVALSALSLEPGDEVLTSDEEHPGLLAPLAALERRVGVGVRSAPFDAIAEHAGPQTRLVACSHVSWVTGQVVDAAALTALDARVLLDGAQGLGAVPVDVRALGCDFYAASGQKWLCGPDGTGCLFARRELADHLIPAWPGFESLVDPARPADLPLLPGARRFDRGAGAGPAAAWWLASLDLLADCGWERVHDRAAALAGMLAEALSERGRTPPGRGRTTLVSWPDPEPEAAVARLATEGILIRDLPGRGLLRASVGAWSSEDELDRLAKLAVTG
jgi:L-cysteine/cystine lyase